MKLQQINEVKGSKKAMTDKIKIGLVGCGQHSSEHFNAAALTDGVEITCCCDIDKKRARANAARYEVPGAYADLDEMLQKEQPDAIILCTWPNQHAEQIEKCLDAGVRNILCEKSLALSALEAMRIWNLANENNAFIMEACKYRFHPAFHKIKELAFSPAAGKIDSIDASFSNYEPDKYAKDRFQNDWRLKKECGGGVPYDLMSYLVNAVNFFAGTLPRRVFASGSIGKNSGVITRIFGQIEYRNGVVGMIESSKEASFTEKLQINCSNVRIVLPVAWGIFGEVQISQTHRKPEWDYILTDTFQIGQANAFVLQLQNFADVIRQNAKPEIPLRESIVNVRTIDALVKSMEEGRIVETNFEF